MGRRVTSKESPLTGVTLSLMTERTTNNTCLLCVNCEVLAIVIRQLLKCFCCCVKYYLNHKVIITYFCVKLTYEIICEEIPYNMNNIYLYKIILTCRHLLCYLKNCILHKKASKGIYETDS